MLSKLLGSYRETWQSSGSVARWFLTGGFFYAIRILMFTVAFPLYARERGFSAGQIGLLLACLSISLFVFGIPIARLSSAGHLGKTLVGGPIIAASGVLLILASQGNAFAPVAIGCLLAGMASNVYWILGDPILAGVVPRDHQSRVFALKFALLTVGFGVGGALGGWIPALLELGGRSRTTALAGALVGVMLIDLCQSLCYRKVSQAANIDPAPRPPGPRGTARSGMWPFVFLLLVPEMGMAVAYQAIRPFLSIFFDEKYGMDPGKTGTIIGIMQLAGGLSVLMLPAIAARHGNVNSMIYLRVFVAACLVGIAGIAILPVALLFLFAQYLILDGTEATFVTEAMIRLPASWRTPYATFGAMQWALFSAFAAALSGALQQVTGGFAASFLLAAIGLTSSAAFLKFGYPRLAHQLSTH